MPLTNQHNMGDLIRQIRQRLELTQEQFAHQLGVTYLTVNRWENQHTKPSPMAIKLIELKLKEMGEQGKDLLDNLKLGYEHSFAKELLLRKNNNLENKR